MKKVAEKLLCEEGTVIEREFEITSSDGSSPGKRHKVRQLHFTGWPDHGVPEGNSMDFEITLNGLIDFLLNSSISEKVVVHCSAGVGRTGTTIALAQLLINISSQINSGVPSPKLSIFSTVRRLREQRFLMVQMLE